MEREQSTWRDRYDRHVLAVRTPLVLGAGTALSAYALIRAFAG